MFRFFRSPLQGIHPAGWAALPMRLAGRAARTLADRRRRAIAYRDLQSLDAQLLRDIGLSHRAAAECARDVREGPECDSGFTVRLRIRRDPPQRESP